MQDAKKGMLFDSFPPVLQIQLRRFEYDFVRDVMIKVGPDPLIYRSPAFPRISHSSDSIRKKHM